MRARHAAKAFCSFILQMVAVQMAEGWARHLKGDVMEAYSAGIEMHGLNPNAVKVMAEAGVENHGVCIRRGKQRGLGIFSTRLFHGSGQVQHGVCVL